MNCKPLARYLGNEDDTLPIRPIDLMTGFLEPRSAEILSAAPCHGDELRRGHDYTKKICSEWWDRWIASYLPLMQQRAKWTKTYRNFQKGDAVLLLDDATPTRGKYPYAIVVGVKTCKDGLVRSATVRTSDGLVRDRDIRKLVLLEASEDTQCNDSSEDLETQTHSSNEGYAGKKIDYVNANFLTFSTDDQNFNCRAGNRSDDASRSNVEFNQRAGNCSDDASRSSVKFNQRAGNRSDDASRSNVEFNQRAGNRSDDASRSNVEFNQRAGNCSDDASRSSVKFNQRAGNRSDDASRSSVKFNQRAGSRTGYQYFNATPLAHQ